MNYLILKEEGLTKAVLAMGKIDIMFPMIKNWDFDVLINHNRYFLTEKLTTCDYAYSKNMLNKYSLCRRGFS